MKLLIKISWSGLALSAVVGAFLAGCQSKTPRLIPGWVESKNSGVVFYLPSDVKVTDLSSGDLKEIENRAKTQFPNQPERQKSVVELASSGAMRLVGSLNAPNSSGVANSLNLVVLPAGSNKTAVDFVDANRVKMLAAAVPGSLTAKLREFPVGDVAYFEFDIASANPPRSQITYLFVHNEEQYLFTFSCGTSEKKIWGSIAETAMKGIHFEP